MQINRALLRKIEAAVTRNFDSYLAKILSASVEQGMFGMELIDRLHDELPATSCGNCGICCNSVSIYSMEYHRIMRYLMSRKDLQLLKQCVGNALNIAERETSNKRELRLRCGFRDDKTNQCLIHPVRAFSCRYFGMPKADGAQECPSVKQLNTQTPLIVDDNFIERIQTPVSNNSESFKPFDDLYEINFFPFEFWVFRYLFSPERALQIYREILVPASTPLQQMWKTARANKPQLERTT